MAGTRKRFEKYVREAIDGWLDNSYLESVNKMRCAVHKKVDALGVVQDVSGAPTFNHQGIAPEAQAFFLLMEAAAEDL